MRVASVGWSGERCFGESEVEELDALFSDEDVGGFQVAVGDAIAVRGVEGFEDLAGVLDSFFDGQRSFEGDALDVLHDEVIGADVVELADVGVIEGGDGAGFAIEAFGELVFGDFEGDDAVEAGIAGFPDFSHASGAERVEDLEGSEAFAGCGHSWMNYIPR